MKKNRKNSLKLKYPQFQEDADRMLRDARKELRKTKLPKRSILGEISNFSRMPKKSAPRSISILSESFFTHFKF
jgi:hypothetical protein